MPLVKLKTSAKLNEQTRKELLVSMSQIIAESIGKPEKFVMVSIDTAAMIMSGKYADAAFIDIYSIGGLNRDVNRNISRKLSILLEKVLKISQDMVYINFTSVSAENWGWNGDIFG